MNKRKFVEIANSVSKRIKCVPKNRPFVSGTAIRNYLLKDPVVDWLNLPSLSTKTKPIFKKTEYESPLMTEGNRFENEVVENLKKRMPVVSVSSQITEETCLKTIDLMKRGCPIIHSAPIQDDELGFRGVVDLLVRDDFIEKFTNQPTPENKNPTTHYYVVVDIKFCTLSLLSNGETLCNQIKFKPYKGQLWIYNECIARIQNYKPNFAYLLGRRWAFRNNSVQVTGNGYTRLGKVDFESSDVKEFKDAVDWVRDVRVNGYKWMTNPPSRKELYPNMCNDSGKWEVKKRELAQHLGEITNIWQCGVKHRLNAHSKNVQSWRDERCTSEVLGFSKTSVYGNIVDEILNTNRTGLNKATINPKKVKNELFNWRRNENEMFVDFETFVDTRIHNSEMRIFMIGVWYNEQYREFSLNSDTDWDEKTIIDEFLNFWRESDCPKIWYWSAEKKIWANRKRRLGNKIEWFIPKNLWCDLSKIFIKEPVTVSGSLNFKLKNIANALYSHGKISTKLESECCDGFNAAIIAKEIYTTVKTEPRLHPKIRDIALYNRFDVKVLSEILTFLRKEK